MKGAFKNPLKKPRTDFTMKSEVFNYASIRKLAGPNVFGILPDTPEVVPTPCTASKDCKATYNSQTKLWGAGCTGACYSC